VAQGTPADMNGLATIVEEGIRYPGFAFINVQSPCVTYGQEDQMLKAQKATMQSLASLKHDPADRLAAMDLAQAYGEKLYTGVFYRQPNPGPTFEGLARERQLALRASVKSRADALNVFRLAKP